MFDNQDQRTAVVLSMLVAVTLCILFTTLMFPIWTKQEQSYETDPNDPTGMGLPYYGDCDICYDKHVLYTDPQTGQQSWRDAGTLWGIGALFNNLDHLPRRTEYLPADYNFTKPNFYDNKFGGD